MSVACASENVARVASGRPVKGITRTIIQIKVDNSESSDRTDVTVTATEICQNADNITQQFNDLSLTCATVRYRIQKEDERKNGKNKASHSEEI